MKKRIQGILLMIILCVYSMNNQVYAKENPDELKELYAQSAVLMDADSGRILFGKNEEKVLPMASTTKIMTCILALENMEDGQTATVSEYAARQPKVHLGAKSGEKFYIKDLLYSLMLESHNDSAVIIAEEIAGSVEAFAEMMNKKAKSLGCDDTHFVTPNGLDAENEEGIHSTTASDLALIMRYCIQESPKSVDFLDITQTKSYHFGNVDGTRSFSCSNHNAFLDMMDGALSGKTGFTAAAGYCYVGALRRDDRTFIVALLACGWPNNKTYKWKDTRKLMEYGIENYEYRNLWEKWENREIQVPNGAEKKNLQVGVSESNKEIMILAKSNEKVEIETKLNETIHAPVKINQTVGYVTYSLGEQVLDIDNIVALENVEEWTISWCLGKITKAWLF